MGIAVLPHAAVQPILRALKLRQVALDETWARRSLLMGVRDVDAVPRHVRLLIDHLAVGA
jgi:hypothetical protein